MMGFSLRSDREFGEPQSSSFSEKRSFVWADSQEEMSSEGPPVEAPQGSSSTARERTVIANMENT